MLLSEQSIVHQRFQRNHKNECVSQKVSESQNQFLSQKRNKMKMKVK